MPFESFVEPSWSSNTCIRYGNPISNKCVFMMMDNFPEDDFQWLSSLAVSEWMSLSVKVWWVSVPFEYGDIQILSITIIKIWNVISILCSVCRSEDTGAVVLWDPNHRHVWPSLKRQRPRNLHRKWDDNLGLCTHYKNKRAECDSPLYLWYMCEGNPEDRGYLNERHQNCSKKSAVQA